LAGAKSRQVHLPSRHPRSPEPAAGQV
jgi:hypothetical protein